MAAARTGPAADALRAARTGRSRRRGARPAHPGVGRPRQPVGRRLSHTSGARRPMDGARIDRRGTDRAPARRGALEDDADGGSTMTMTNAESYASIAARERQ